MKLSVVLAVLIGILLFAYSSAVPAPAEPTPNIDATVEARAKQLVAAQATPTPYPTYAQSLRGRHLKDTGDTKNKMAHIAQRKSPLTYSQRAFSCLDRGAPDETRTHNPWVRSLMACLHLGIL